MAKKDKRFILLYSESSSFQDSQIWVDRETGVNYLWHAFGNAGGLTPLLKADGTPVITPKGELLED